MLDRDDLDIMEARAKETGPTTISWKSPRAASDILDLIAALRAERARTERLQVALNFAGTWMATDLSPEGTQAYADFLALAETKELP